MASELLNSYITNNPSGCSSRPVVNLNTKALDLDVSKQSADLNLKPDTFEKKSNKKVYVGVIAAGVLLLAGGFIVLGKKGKLGEGLQTFINNFFNCKTAETAANSAQAAAPRKTGSAVSDTVQKHLPPEIRPEKITQDGTSINKPLNVQYNSKGITHDVGDWARMHTNMPKDTDYVHSGKHLPINREFNEFEIKPHSYADDTDIIMTARDYTCDFQTYKIENGKMAPVSGHASDGIPKQSAEEFAYMDNGYSARAGHYDDGRKFVSFKFLNGEIVDTRPGYEVITLVSKGTEFTQAQKDAIRIFETVGDRKFGAGIPTPFTFATITPNLHPSTCSPGELSRRTNRNALLSVISSWAEHSPKFNVDEHIQKMGDTFNIGF